MPRLPAAIGALLIAPAAALSIAPSGAAADASWSEIVDVRSADLSLEGWSLASSSAAGLADGREALITFWKAPDGQFTVRCIDLFDLRMEPVSGRCEMPRGGAAPGGG